LVAGSVQCDSDCAHTHHDDRQQKNSLFHDRNNTAWGADPLFATEGSWRTDTPEPDTCVTANHTGPDWHRAQARTRSGFLLDGLPTARTQFVNAWPLRTINPTGSPNRLNSRRLCPSPNEWDIAPEGNRFLISCGWAVPRRAFMNQLPRDLT
jgi:hypothetical protein